MPTCDPYWTEKNGGCSDEFGRFIDTKTGATVVPARDLTSVLAHVSAFLGGENNLKAGDPPKPGFDLQEWLGTGYNMIYVAIAFVAVLFVMNSAKGGRR